MFTIHIIKLNINFIIIIKVVGHNDNYELINH